MSPQTAPSANEVATDRGALIDQMRKIAQALNELDGSLKRGQVVVAQDYSTVLRSELTGLALMLGIA